MTSIDVPLLVENYALVKQVTKTETILNSLEIWDYVI